MFTVPVHFVQQYTQNIQDLLQQKGGKLRSCVSMGTYLGKAVKAVEQFGEITPVRDLPRHSDTPLLESADDARWIAPHDYDAAVLIDRQDKVRMLIDPQAAYTRNMVNGFRRREDDEILGAFFTNSLTGENGTTSTAYPASSQDVSVNEGGTNSGLNVAKLRAGKQILEANGVDLENDEIYMLINSKHHNKQLMNEIQVISKDYNNTAVLVNGRVEQFLGINFKHIEFLNATAYPFAASTATLFDADEDFLPMWSKSMMHLGDWQELSVDVGPRRDKRNAQQVYVASTIGATRLQEKGVVRVRVFTAA